MSGIQAALGISQLKRINKFINIKRNIAKEYEKNLKNVEGLTLVNERKNEKHVYWMIGALINKKYKLNKEKIIKRCSKMGLNQSYPN